MGPQVHGTTGTRALLSKAVHAGHIQGSECETKVCTLGLEVSARATVLQNVMDAKGAQQRLQHGLCKERQLSFTTECLSLLNFKLYCFWRLTIQGTNVLKSRGSSNLSLGTIQETTQLP